MNVEYINPFILSTIKVFETMVACTMTRRAPMVKGSYQPTHEISAIIGLSGRARGTVVLSVEREVALQSTGALLGERPAELNADVADALGELTNMIAGNAKAQLEQFAMSVSLPTVITGRSHSIDFPRNVPLVCIPFQCPWGSLTLEVALIENAPETT